MDTMNVTKIVAGICASFLIFLLLKWGAEIIYHPGGHGEMEAAYTLEVEEAPEAGGEEEGPSFAEILASADAAKGEKVFGKCKACHKLGAGENATGPSLFNIVDRDRGTEAGFGYSAALAALGGTWTAEELNGFFTKPKDYLPGTTMGFAGLKKEEDRANLIAYLMTQGG